MQIDLTEYGYAIHSNARKKGFWEPEQNEPDTFYIKQMMMIVSEVAEVMEAFRKDMGSDVIEEEFADILIRTLDLYTGLHRAGIVKNDLAKVLEDKMQFNTERPHMHGVRG